MVSIGTGSSLWGAFDGEQAVEALGRVLLEERASPVRRMAAYALSRLGDEAAFDALAAARLDRDRTVRTLAEATLARELESSDSRGSGMRHVTHLCARQASGGWHQPAIHRSIDLRPLIATVVFHKQKQLDRLNIRQS